MRETAPPSLPVSDDPEIPMPTPRLESYVEGLRITKNVWGVEDEDE
jgi:hypothetical protein